MYILRKPHSESNVFYQMVRTVARYHEEKKLNEERARKEEQNKLRRIAASIAREIEYFWSNIEQVNCPLP